jgi:hypothetical protein
MSADLYYHSCEHCETGDKIPTSFTRRAWVIVDKNGHFFNPRNGDYNEILNIPVHIYWNKDKAEEVAKGYNLYVISVQVTTSLGE